MNGMAVKVERKKRRKEKCTARFLLTYVFGQYRKQAYDMHGYKNGYF